MADNNKKSKYYYGTGRRKTAVARVRLYDGSGKALVNGKDVSLKDNVISPIKLIGKLDSIDLSIIVTGGGINGQYEAIRHGISRALISMNPEYRQTLKKAGYLTRDQREVERKKPGLKKARRAPQWSKR